MIHFVLKITYIISEQQGEAGEAVMEEAKDAMEEAEADAEEANDEVSSFSRNNFPYIIYFVYF